jgi:hypothetical protein
VYSLALSKGWRAGSRLRGVRATSSRLAGFSRISKSRRQSGDAGAARLIAIDKVWDAGSSVLVNDVVAAVVRADW